MRFFLIGLISFSAFTFFSCGEDLPVTPPTAQTKFKWEQVDSISPIGYFANSVAAAENNTYYYISNQYLYRCTPTGKTPIDISGNFGPSTIEVYDNNYIIIGGEGAASTTDSSISKVKILANDILTEFNIDTVSDIYPAVVYITRPGRFYYASRNVYYLVEDGVISKFTLSGVNNVTGFSKIGNTMYVLAYNLGTGQSIFRLQADNSPVLFENENSPFPQIFSTKNNLIKSQYFLEGQCFMYYLTESGWVNFYRGGPLFFNYAAADDLSDLYMVSNLNGVFRGNIWNGSGFSEDLNYPFKEERYSSLYYGNMKDGIVYLATVYDKVRIYKGKRLLQ